MIKDVNKDPKYICDLGSSGECSKAFTLSDEHPSYRCTKQIQSNLFHSLGCLNASLKGFHFCNLDHSLDISAKGILKYGMPKLFNLQVEPAAVTS